jgi:hypothetical protein
MILAKSSYTFPSIGEIIADWGVKVPQGTTIAKTVFIAIARTYLYLFQINFCF